MNFQPHLRPPGKGGRQRPKGRPEGIPGQGVGNGAGALRHAGLQGVGQHIKARVGDQPRREASQQVAVENRHVRPQPPIHQGVLHMIVGQNGEIRHLRPGAGGGGNGHQTPLLPGKIDHGLGAVHGAAAPQGHHRIRPELPEPGGSLRRQGHRGIRRHPVKKGHRLRLCRGGHMMGRAVLHKIGIRHHKQPPGALLCQGLHRAGTGYDLRPARKSFHTPTSFSRLVFPKKGGSCIGFSKNPVAGAGINGKPIVPHRRNRIHPIRNLSMPDWSDGTKNIVIGRRGRSDRPAAFH